MVILFTRWDRFRSWMICLIAGKDQVACNLVINKDGAALTVPNGVPVLGGNNHIYCSQVGISIE